MQPATTFDSTRDFLQATLEDVQDGKIQLPDFQRGWVWDDDHIRSLLASVSLSYPIGAVMLMETGNTDVRFKPRPVEGVKLQHPRDPERLILDGQQRLTSLFLSLASGKAVETHDARSNRINRWYYVDIAKALDPFADREEAIVGISEDRVLRNFRSEVLLDLSSREREYAAGYFPLSEVFHYLDWRLGYQEFVGFDQTKLQQFGHFEQAFIIPFTRYQVPLILLRRETPKEAVCQVFEKVNTGGVPLTVFELLTATFAADDFNLRDDWDKRRQRFGKHKVLASLESTFFLQAVTLVATFVRKQTQPDAAISCKRKDVLRLSLADYRSWAEPVTVAFEKVAQLMHTQKVFAARDLPYTTQLVPLAAMRVVLGDRADTDSVRAKLARWHWCGVFGELYGSSVETRFAKDLPEVVDWVQEGPEPTTVAEATFAPERLFTMRTRNSAAYKGLSALLLRDGALDLRSGIPVDAQMYFDESIEIHHIFPRDYCAKTGIDRSLSECIVNKTPLSAKTNRIIGAKPPSVYLSDLEKDAGATPGRLDQIVLSHVIQAAALRADNFDVFFSARYNALLDRIEQAMGKPIARDTQGFSPQKLAALQAETAEFELEETA
jgi:hypothetical protein